QELDRSQIVRELAGQIVDRCHWLAEPLMPENGLGWAAVADQSALGKGVHFNPLTLIAEPSGSISGGLPWPDTGSELTAHADLSNDTLNSLQSSQVPDSAYSE